MVSGTVRPIEMCHGPPTIILPFPAPVMHVKDEDRGVSRTGRIRRGIAHREPHNYNNTIKGPGTPGQRPYFCPGLAHCHEDLVAVIIFLRKKKI